LALPLARLAEAAPEVSDWLAEDVRAFGELLYQLASGQESRETGGAIASGNPAFDVLVSRCFASYAGATQGYVCLADEGLRHDLQKALDHEARRQSGPRWVARLRRLTRAFARRGRIAIVGATFLPALAHGLTQAAGAAGKAHGG
jgi:hypothetical protein